MIIGLVAVAVVIVVVVAGAIFLTASGNSGPPSAPAITAWNDIDGVRINWTIPSQGGSAVEKIRIYMAEVANGSQGAWGPISDNTGQIAPDGTGLEAARFAPIMTGHTYAFRVTAINSFGESPPSNEVTVGPLHFVPDAPDFLSDWGANYVQINWTAPSDDGGKPITSYVLQRAIYDSATYAESDWHNITFGVDTLSYNDTSVSPGIDYEYYLVAFNEIGQSAHHFLFVKPGQASAPINFTAKAYDGYVIFSWKPPLKDCGSPITGYVLTRTNYATEKTDTINLGLTTSYNDTSLSIGIQYQYRVKATNALGGVGLEAQPAVDFTYNGAGTWIYQ